MKIEFVIDKKVVGYIKTQLIYFENAKRTYLRITDLYINPVYQKMGIGTFLIKVALKQKHDCAEVVTQKEAGFYEKMGFERVPNPRLIKINKGG